LDIPNHTDLRDKFNRKIFGGFVLRVIMRKPF
jgi:hypothetical protein